MATSRRILVSKTYGKSSRSDCSSSKAFDEAMKIKSNSNTFNIKAASTISKWGKMTFTSTKISCTDHKIDTRKRELVEEPEDPFSFEPEFSPFKIKRSTSPQPPIPKYNSVQKTDIEENEIRYDVKQDVLYSTKSSNNSHKPERKFYRSKNNNNDIKLKITISESLESVNNDNPVINDSVFNYKVNHEILDSVGDKFNKDPIEDDEDNNNDNNIAVINNHILPSVMKNKLNYDEIIDKNIIENNEKIKTNQFSEKIKMNQFIETIKTIQCTENIKANENEVICNETEKIDSHDNNNNDITTTNIKCSKDEVTKMAASHILNGLLPSQSQDDSKKNLITRRKFLCSKSASQKKAKYKYRMWHEDEEDNNANSSENEEKSKNANVDAKKLKSVFDNIDEFNNNDNNKIINKKLIKNGNTNFMKDTIKDCGIDDDDDDFPVFKKPSCSSYSKSNSQKSEHSTQELDDQTQVVRDVKQAHECQESGETQEFEDDIEFIMDGLNCKQKLSIRCLSALSLLTKCTSSVFRMHLRAHGTLSKVFKILSDAPECPALGLCVACLFLLMSRDRLFVDVERTSYELLLKLLDVDDSISTSTTIPAMITTTTTTMTKYSTTTCSTIPTALNNNNKKASFFKSKHSKKNEGNKDYENVQQKVFHICHGTQHQHLQQQQQFSEKPLLPDLTLEQTVTSKIAMEALLRFSSRKDADGLKEDLRLLGGFDRIIDATCLSIDEFDRNIYDDDDDDNDEDAGSGLNNSNIKLMNKIENCLQVLANVTNLNEANQTHLILHKSATIINHLDRCLKKCIRLLRTVDLIETNGKLEKEGPGYMVYNVIISLLNVFINITHDNTCGSMKAGSSTQLVENLFTCLLLANQSLPACCRFDLIVLCLGLLINLVEHCRSNLRILLSIQLQHSISNKTSTLRALGNFFTHHYDAARQFEEEHDAELEKQQQQQLQNDNNKSSTNKMADCSGEWVESEMGVEWVSHHHDNNNNNNNNNNKDNDNVDDIGGGSVGNSQGKKSWSSQDSQQHRINSLFSQDNESINKALNKAGKHMEDSVVAAYVALLIGCIVQHDSDLAEEVRDTLPDFSFEPLSRMLRKFYNFMSLTQGMRPSCDKSILQVLDVLDAC